MVSPRFVIQRAPSSRAMIAIGSTMPNSQRHPRVSRTAPERVGPMAGASEITRPTRPIMRPREWAGTTFMIVVISSGIMMPVPMAWMTRPTSSIGNPSASRQTRVPSENALMANRNTWRVVKRCSRKPVVGMTTAITSMKPLVSHCPFSGAMPRSWLRCGMAIAIVVSLRIATKAATSSSQMTRIPCGSMPVADGAAGCGEGAVSCEDMGLLGQGGGALARVGHRRFGRGPAAGSAGADGPAGRAGCCGRRRTPRTGAWRRRERH
jgi:hypothetical protein